MSFCRAGAEPGAAQRRRDAKVHPEEAAVSQNHRGAVAEDRLQAWRPPAAGSWARARCGESLDRPRWGGGGVLGRLALTLTPPLPRPSAEHAGPSPPQVRGPPGVVWRFGARPFSLSLSVGGGLPSLPGQRRGPREAGVSPSPLHRPPPGGRPFTVHGPAEGSPSSSLPPL